MPKEKAYMSVLRATRELEMDCDIDERTEVLNVDRDSPDCITLYGTEKNGKLWYIVMNQALVDQIKEV